MQRMKNLLAVRDLDDPIEMIDGARLLVRARSSNLAEEVDVTPQIY